MFNYMKREFDMKTNDASTIQHPSLREGLGGLVIEIDNGSGFCFGVTTAIRVSPPLSGRPKKNWHAAKRSTVWATSFIMVWSVNG